MGFGTLEICVGGMGGEEKLCVNKEMEIVLYRAE